MSLGLGGGVNNIKWDYQGRSHLESKFKLRREGIKGLSHMDIWRKSVSSRENNKHKCIERGTCKICLTNGLEGVAWGARRILVEDGIRKIMMSVGVWLSFLAEEWQHLTVFQKLTLIGVITKDYWEARVKAGR